MNISEMLDEYTSWLRKEITVTKFGEYQELTTPYLDRYNDYLQIYVRQEPDGKIIMTDDGHIISNLISAGMSLKSSPKRRQMLDRILRNFSMEQKGDEITTFATIEDFSKKKHLMMQAMLAVDDMFELSAENVKDFFVEDIETFFNANEIFFSRDFSLTGKTGSIYTYDFHFQRTKERPERFCKALNKVNESKRNMTIFNWIDTLEQRKEKSELIVMLNDENNINDVDIRAFENYSIKPVRFSERQNNLNIFAA